ncbi:hypothetical protein FHU38_000835 [Saccharomonospora amisosensis]|uniref:Asparagine synthetase domain-containing protein n=1 Tax=Saccharomonospora amisosensis TaxID=1128677 RepID=A0A7X5UM00_9PSEU|nr:asparagine synthase-related protein [Saccharomonospora amisosensis]NIJ10491.1 hypothetical protein [Saccharomonospora amisosensis]
MTDDSVVSSDTDYTARLIEGYDIEGIRRLYDGELSTAGGQLSACQGLLKRRLAVAPDGKLSMERAHLDNSAGALHVEETVVDTVERFSLLPEGSTVVLGLSGGVDSGSLLMLLSSYRRRHPSMNIRIQAATFEDFDSRYSETFSFASRLAKRFDIEHTLVEADKAERVFNLTRPVEQILLLLMESDDAHQAMYVDHHTTRRVLEVFADEVGSDTVALGLHTTDLLAGLLNSWTSGYDIGPIPERQIGIYRYVLPLAFVPKRELHLYYADQLGHLPKQTTPNQWEFNPTDRNFYYYLADHLQWLWPGLQHWAFTAHNAQASETVTFETCENCGAAAREQPNSPAWSGLCDVCTLFDKHGWLRMS